MADVLYYILGNSDIKFDGQSIKENYRPITDQLRNIIEKDDFSTEYQCKFEEDGMVFPKKKPVLHGMAQDGKDMIVARVDFPIFPVLFDSLETKPSRIVFWATDQEGAHNKGDTIHAAYILSYWLKRRLRSAFAGSIHTIHQDPSDYDGMADYFVRYVHENQRQLAVSRHNYFALSSGTPAMVNAFSMATIDYNFRYFYIARGTPPRVSELACLPRWNRQRHAEKIMALVRRYQYEGAKAMLDQSPFRHDEVLAALLASLSKRINYDYFNALNEVRALRETRISRYTDELSELAGDNELAFTCEMIARIEITHQVNDVHAAIALIFNLLENVRYLLVKKFAGVEIVRVDNDFPAWREYLISCGLFSPVELGKIMERLTSRKTILKVFKALQKTNNDPALQQAIAFMDKLELCHDTPWGKYSLQDLRNEGPFAHGSKGMPVDETIFTMIWPQYGFRQLLNELRDFIGLFVNLRHWHNPFVEINHLLEELFKERIQ